jgi:hypothetical protein
MKANTRINCIFWKQVPLLPSLLASKFEGQKSKFDHRILEKRT